MALIRQNSIYIPDHISYKHELVKYRKMFIKYVKGFYVGNPFEWERRQRREFVIFHRRKKIIRKVNYIHGMTSPLVPNISDCIELLKGRKGLSCAPLKMQFLQSYTKEHRILNSKYFKCLGSVQEMFLSSHGAIDKALPTLARQTRALNRMKSFRLYLNSSSTQEIDLSKGINQLLNTLNSFKSLDAFSFNLHDIQLSNSSLKELFKFDRLKRPIQTLQILTNRQLDMEDEFDDFFPPAEPKQSSEPIYKGFSTITSLAEHLVYLHLQPVLRDASDQQWLRYFFIPLSGLKKLRSLNLEMPNLELCENDVNVLSYSIKHLESLNTVKVLIQFGMISQKTLDNFFSSFECLNLRQVDLSLSFATVVDYSTFFKSIAKNKEIEKLSLNKTYLANMYFDPMQCDFLFTCLNLRSIRISALPLINGLLPTKERFNCCFKSAFKALQNLLLLESFSFENPKVSADNDNLRVVTETLPLLHNLQELILVINWKEHEVSSEIGIQFWEVVLKKPMLKTLIINALFKGAEKILPMIRTKIDNMTNLQCIAMHFASEVIEAQQVLGMVKRLRLCDVIKEIHLHFKVNFLLSEKIIQKIQQILKEPKYLKKCIVEIQSVGGKQSIDSESKSIFRGGQELNYF